MLKIVVFDGGYGGEFFADRLEEELPVVEVIRVIDWRNAKPILESPHKARKIAAQALRPYIGKVDLIIFANHLLTLTSLKYFRRKYREQKFLGLDLKEPDTFVQRDVLILTTKAVARTISYRNFVLHLKRRTKTLTLDDWPAAIDDGELTEPDIKYVVETALVKTDLNPQEVILACSQFEDIKEELRHTLGASIKIYDSFDGAIKQTCKTLKIRGGNGRRRH